MDTAEKTKKTTFNCFSAIIITQCICVAIIIFALLGLKLCFKKEFLKARNWYIQNICVDTDINEVLSGEDTQNEV